VRLIVHEVSLGRASNPKTYHDTSITRDQMRAWYVGEKAGGRQSVVVDGVKGPVYDEVRCDPVFSPDSKRMAYRARRGERLLWVLDGVELPPFDRPVDDDGPLHAFSPDSRRFAYSVKRGGKSAVVLDGAEGASYDKLHESGIHFSPDSRRCAYGAQRDGKWRLVLDGVEGEPCDSLGWGFSYPCEFSPDSQRVAYAARRGKEAFVVLDGKEGRPFTGVHSTQFSPDSRRLAYVGYRAERWPFFVSGIEERDYLKVWLVVDGVEGQPFDDVWGGAVYFSPDSKHIAFGALRGDNALVVKDAAEEHPYCRDSEIHQFGPFPHGQAGPFSPDSKRFAYFAERDDKKVVVLDGVDSERYDDVPYLSFSPDSRHVAYVARRGGQDCLVLDGRVVAIYPTSGCGIFVCFSPDSQRLIWTVGEEDKQLVVVDGVAGNAYDDIGPPVFTPDSRHVAYLAYKNQKALLVVDGAESPRYGGFPSWKASPVIDGPDALHFMVHRDNRLLRIEVRIVAEPAAPAPETGAAK